MCVLFLSDYIIITLFSPSFFFLFLGRAIVICCVVGMMIQMIELCWRLYIHRTPRPKNANSSGQTIQVEGHGGGGLSLFCQALHVQCYKDKNKSFIFLSTAFKLNLKTSYASVQGLNLLLKRKSTAQFSLS